MVCQMHAGPIHTWISYFRLAFIPCWGSVLSWVWVLCFLWECICMLCTPKWVIQYYRVWLTWECTSSGMLMYCIFLWVHGCVCTTPCYFGHMCTEKCQVGSFAPPDLLEPAETWQECKLAGLDFRQLWLLLVMNVSGETPLLSIPLWLLILPSHFFCSYCFTVFAPSSGPLIIVYCGSCL